MATSFNNLVKCPECFENHDDPKRLPVCDHVFCVTCLGRIVGQGVIICPKCSSRNTVPAGDVKHLKTDLSIKQMIESFRCADCKIIEQHSKQCIHCQVVVCSTCSEIHDFEEKCELLSSIRSLSMKVPTSEESQTIEQLKVEWVKFKSKNAEQKLITAAWMDNLIISLQEKKTTILSTYDEYDEFAKERLQWLEEAKEMERIVQDLEKLISEKEIETVVQAQRGAERHNEFFSKKKQILSEIVPCHLGLVYTTNIKQKIAAIGRQIIRRKPGEEKSAEIISWTEKGEIWKRNPRTGFPEKKLAVGTVELVLEGGENYTLRVVDENHVSKWVSETWNNRDDSKASLRVSSCSHLSWALHRGNDATLYSTMFAGQEKRELLEEAMLHSSYVDLAIRP